MNEILIEIYSEEIPARLVRQAETTCADMIINQLKHEKLIQNSQNHKIITFSTPNRIGLAIQNIPSKQPDIIQEKKGPRINAPQNVINGFLKSINFSSTKQCTIQKDQKGDFYIAQMRKKGRKTQNIIPDIIKHTILNFPWQKSMRWYTTETEEIIKWIRPLRGIICIYNQKAIRFNIAQITSGNETYGHKFMSPKKITVKNFNEYKSKLLNAHVIINHKERADIIQNGIDAVLDKKKHSIIPDNQLLSETAGLTEWPVIHVGDFNPEFLKLPKEVIIAALRNHQKCFSVQNTNTQTLAPKYIIVANIETHDGGEKIIQGYNRVINARLKDAQFFQQQDLKIPLDHHNEKLKKTIFHSKIGTQYERTERIATISRLIAKHINQDQTITYQAAKITKADLSTNMVIEFPELQGIIGGYYAKKQKKNIKIVQAIEEQYKPKGPNDKIPKTKIGQIIALADKIDTITAFHAINEKPTGSRDPFALRRAAIGIIRILIEGNINLNLNQIIKHAAKIQNTKHKTENNQKITQDVIQFILERLKILLKQKNIPHDLINAVLNEKYHKKNLSLPNIIEKIHAIKKLTQQKNGQKTIAAIERVENILNIEEKKDKKIYQPKPNPKLFTEKQEQNLFQNISDATNTQHTTQEKQNIQNIIKHIKHLQNPINAFFNHVMINHPNHKIRQNRLKLLAKIRTLTSQIATFSKIENKNQ